MGDLVHRVGWTFVETFLTFTVAEPVIELVGGTVNLGFWQVAVGSAIASSLVVVKEYARKQVNARRSTP